MEPAFAALGIAGTIFIFAIAAIGALVWWVI
jgi:hypothetical protein